MNTLVTYFLRVNPLIIGFFTSIVIMILEISGSRILSPYIGGSTIVWSSLIGIVLGSLSLGYMLGGRLSNKLGGYFFISLLLFFSSISLLLVTLFYKLIIEFIVGIYYQNIILSSIFSSIALFFLPNALFGMVMPFIFKIKSESIKKSGSSFGDLSAVNTIGSIIGTFLTGFVLFGRLGTYQILLILSFTMLGLSFLASIKKLLLVRILFGVVIVYLFIYPQNNELFNFSRRLRADEIDTAYARVLLFDVNEPMSNRKVRLLHVGGYDQSAVFLDKPNELVFDYMKYFRLAKYYNPNLKKTLLIGGGALNYPRDFILQNPSSRIDVIEIDGKFENIAKEKFFYKDDSRIKVIVADGRQYINSQHKKYDAVYLDVFGSINAVPFQLATKESFRRISELLNKRGVVVMNLISAVNGEKGKLFRAEYRTMKSVFPEVKVFLVRDVSTPDDVQNIVMVGMSEDSRGNYAGDEIKYYLDHKYDGNITRDLPVLSDNFAPVEEYALKLY